MSNLDSVIVVPIFNEEGTLEKVLMSWADALSELNIRYGIYAYDDGSTDGSTDGTPAQLRELESRIPQLTAQSKLNSGHGPTWKAPRRGSPHPAKLLYMASAAMPVNEPTSRTRMTG